MLTGFFYLFNGYLHVDVATHRLIDAVSFAMFLCLLRGISQAHSNFLASGAFVVVFVGGFSFVNLAFFQHYLLGMVWSISCILWGHLFAWCLHTVKLAVAEEKFTTMERLEIVKLSNILLE